MGTTHVRPPSVVQSMNIKSSSLDSSSKAAPLVSLAQSSRPLDVRYAPWGGHRRPGRFCGGGVQYFEKTCPRHASNYNIELLMSSSPRYIHGERRTCMEIAPSGSRSCTPAARGFLRPCLDSGSGLSKRIAFMYLSSSIVLFILPATEARGDVVVK